MSDQPASPAPPAAPATPPPAEPGLSLRERQRGRRLYYTYGFFNSISFAVLAEGVVVLALLRLGATPAWVGAVSALMYVTMPFMLLGYRTIPRLGVTGTAAVFWALRSLSSAAMIAAPWGAAAFGREAGLWLMFLGALGFMLGRAAGMVAFTGIITELTTRLDRGALITTAFKIHQPAAIAVTAMVAVFLGLEAPLHRYQVFFAVGLTAGLLAATALWRIPEAGIFRQRPPFRPLAELRWLLATHGRRWFLGMMVSIPLTQGITRTFILLVAKQGYGLPDQTVVWFIVVSMVGGVLASYTYGLFLDQLGSRPLLVLTSIVDTAGMLAIVFLPAELPVVALGAIFFITGYVTVAFNSASQHYFISITGTAHQLPQGIINQGLGGLAGGAAVYAAGVVLEHLGVTLPSATDTLLPFRWFFGGVVVLLVLRTLVFVKLPPLRSQGLRDSLNVLFSPSDWRAIHAVKRAISVQSEDEEARAVAALRRSGSAIYRDDLVRYLESPSIVVRQRAMDALAVARPNRHLVDVLLRDLRVNLFTTAHDAAYWLGRWKVQAAREPLREALDSPDFLLRGQAIHALLELDDREALPLIEARFAASENPYVLIEGARALSLWGEERHYGVLLDKYHLDIPPQAKDELSLSVARLLGLYDAFYRDLGMLHRDPAQLYREWRERLAPRDREGLIEDLRIGEPRRSALEQSLDRQRPDFQPWFSDTTATFLAQRPERVWPEMAFLMTFLLLTPTGLHRAGDRNDHA